MTHPQKDIISSKFQVLFTIFHKNVVKHNKTRQITRTQLTLKWGCCHLKKTRQNTTKTLCKVK